MERRRLARTDLHVGRVVYGTMTFGDQVDEREAAEMVHACRDAGVTMFDTSNNYAGGASEEILGRIVKPFRDEVTISTKGGSHVDQQDSAVVGLTRKAIHEAVDGSLRRLGVDHIDLYYFHRPDWNTPIEESLEAISEVVAAGKVRHVGQSNYAAWQIAEMTCLSERHGWPQVRVSQQMYNLLGRRIEAEYAACARRLNLSTIVYNPLAGGLLTGKHRRERVPESAGRFARPVYRERYWHPVLFEAVERLREVADASGLTLVELSLRWLLGQPLVDCLLLGASSLEQLRTNLAALEGPPLDEQTLAACDDVWSGIDGAAPHYNR